ncbi:MAG: response regulator [Myxococcota bacterium]
MDPAWEAQALRILVVEDDLDDQELLRLAIERNDVAATLEPAFSGRDALQMLEDGPPPDLILLDLRLPDMAGLEILRRVKQHPQWARIPVIILSGSANPTDVEEGYAAHASAYLQKPTSRDGWQQLVRSFVDYWLKAVLLPKG